MVDEQGISPLYLASMAGSLALLRAILRSSSTTTTAAASFPVSYAGPDGQTALHAATFLQNSAEIAQGLLHWSKMLAKRADNSGSTPLHYAASAGSDEMVKLLLEHDTSLAYIADSSGLFPVHAAVITNKVSVIDEFVKHCPDSDELLDSKGRNLLHTAVEDKKIAIVQYVCKRPEIVKLMNARDYEENTPLHLAVRNGDQGITGARASPRRMDHFLRDNIKLDSEKESKKQASLTQSLIITSALIATVTFAAAFMFPGG
ncbi:uncharacterized protein [Typha latifolia]|uniref:uncharacterized protein n=1 Tax=Typha latifolia TaxID=4733 RepID=UPI003C2F20E1